jgi:hypothetical protein
MAAAIGGTASADPLSVLAEALDPPDPSTVHAAVNSLVEVGALAQLELPKGSTAKFELTPLGWHLSKLPVDARLGKMMIYGALFGVRVFFQATPHHPGCPRGYLRTGIQMPTEHATV